jgi:hypothetical protein
MITPSHGVSHSSVPSHFVLSLESVEHTSIIVCLKCFINTYVCFLNFISPKINFVSCDCLSLNDRALCWQDFNNPKGFLTKSLVTTTCISLNISDKCLQHFFQQSKSNEYQ